MALLLPITHYISSLGGDQPLNMQPSVAGLLGRRWECCPDRQADTLVAITAISANYFCMILGPGRRLQQSASTQTRGMRRCAASG